MTWGDEQQVRIRFEAAGISAANIEFERATWHFRQPAEPSELLATFRNFYGPTMNAFEAAARNNREQELAEELELLFKSQNRSRTGTNIPATYLRVTVHKG
jgi:hypothetical protein